MGCANISTNQADGLGGLGSKDCELGLGVAAWDMGLSLIDPLESRDAAPCLTESVISTLPIRTALLVGLLPSAPCLKGQVILNFTDERPPPALKTSAMYA